MTNKLDTLVILTPGFPKDEQDSTCLPAQQLFVRALNMNYPGLRVVILAMEYPFSESNYTWHQNLVIPFNGWNRTKWRKIWLWISVWRELSRLRRENSILGLLSFWCTSCALVGRWYSQRHGLKHFTWVLGQDARKDNRYIRFIRPPADQLVAMSDSLVEEFFRNHGVRPQHIVPNGLDASIYPPEPLRRDIDVLGVGSLIALKQYDIFLSIIKRLEADLPDIRCVICGKGPEEVRLWAAIQEMGLQERVILTGELSHDQVLQWMQRSRVLLHTSSYEGFSTVCLEALYAGSHVVSLCHPMDAWIKHWHVANDEEELEELVRDILKDSATDHTPVLLYTMNENAQKMMRLFHYKEEATV